MTAHPPRYSSLHHQIEQAIARGETNDQICDALGVTPVTVDEARDEMDAAADDLDDEYPTRRPLGRPQARPQTPFGVADPVAQARPMGSTPGYEALAEAMRLEQARIYGQLQHEHTQPIAEPVRSAEVHDIAAERERRRGA